MYVCALFFVLFLLSFWGVFLLLCFCSFCFLPNWDGKIVWADDGSECWMISMMFEDDDEDKRDELERYED